MAWWVVTLKPNRSSPYLNRCNNEEDAEAKKEKAETQGLSAEVYHTATDDIKLAKGLLRTRISEDFGYSAGNSNYASN